MTTFEIIVAVAIIAIPSALALWFFISLAWIAKGEPDVNGDPERDANQQKTPASRS